MGKIICLMGKSASGKDTIYRELIEDHRLGLSKVIPYTTRPIRQGEQEGREYYFCSDAKARELERQGKIIEMRSYQTIYGEWKYFTADDGQICLEQYNYLLIGTLDTYRRIRGFFGKAQVLPVYIEVDDRQRLLRAIEREASQAEPGYEELCRRFLADAKDFSEEQLQKEQISVRFVNQDLLQTVEEIAKYITQETGHGGISGHHRT